MPQQILSPIDLRTTAQRQGLQNNNQISKDIMEIMQVIGKAEQTRREREKLDRITRAISNGATNIEAIQAAAEEGPSFAGGIGGFLQKFAGAFQPQTGGGIGQNIQEAIIGNALQKSFQPKSSLSADEQAESERIKAGLKPKASAELIRQKRLKKVRTDNLATLNNKNKSDIEKDEARASLDADPLQPKNPIPANEKRDFIRLLDEKDESKKNVRGGFDEKIYNKMLIKAQDMARRKGLEPTGVKAEFDKWWDARVDREQGGIKGKVTKNVTVPRSEFKGAAKEIADDDERLQTAPDTRLDPFWAGLPDEEKKEIIQRLDENPDNIDSILRILQSG